VRALVAEGKDVARMQKLKTVPVQILLMKTGSKSLWGILKITNRLPRINPKSLRLSSIARRRRG
jgi:hypothetical protein